MSTPQIEVVGVNLGSAIRCGCDFVDDNEYRCKAEEMLEWGSKLFIDSPQLCVFLA
jgi:hypothetical protein